MKIIGSIWESFLQENGGESYGVKTVFSPEKQCIFWWLSRDPAMEDVLERYLLIRLAVQLICDLFGPVRLGHRGGLVRKTHCPQNALRPRFCHLSSSL